MPIPQPAPTSPPAAKHLARGVAAIVVAVVSLSLGDAIIKMTSATFAMSQIFVVRSAVVLVLLALVIAARPPFQVVPSGWSVARSILLAAMWVAYYAALPQMPLSAAAAVYYTLPFFITLLSALVTGEPVGRRGWVAIAVGFAGVLLILRPGAAAFTPYAVLPLLAAICYAAAMVITRQKCRDEHPLALALAVNVTFVVGGALAAVLLASFAPDEEGFLLRGWTAMGLPEWGAMAVLSIVMLVATIGTAIAYQSGPASVIGTFDFSYVAGAVVWGILFFGEIPGPTSAVGLVLIVGAGVLAVRAGGRSAA